MVAAISVDSVTKTFGALKAVSNLSLTVEEGEFFGLLGPNGAGKTTLISMLAGLTRADSGKLRIMGHDVVSDYRLARRALGLVPQEVVFDPFFTPREALKFQSGYFGIRKNDAWIEELLHNLDLTDKGDSTLRTLSGGMKRRFLIAQALVHRPPVIILDEPTAGVDVELRQSLWQFIRRLNENGHTIILTTHYLEEAEALCNRLALVKHGQIIAIDETYRLLANYGGLRARVEAECVEVPAELAFLSYHQEGKAWFFDLDNYEQVEMILAAFREAGVTISSLDILKADLEQVFLDLMQNK